jgi:hypothetical protein
MIGVVALGCCTAAGSGGDRETAAAGPLTLRVRTDKATVAPGETIWITVEISNGGMVDQVVYMPGITGGVLF